MLAKIENVIEGNNIVQVSIAYNDHETDIHEQLKPYNDNKILISLIKKICYKLKLNFNEFWVDIIYPIDKQRKEEEEENLLEYFKVNRDLVTELLSNKFENYNDILECINENMQSTNQKITSKIGLISIGGLPNTKKVLEEFLFDQSWTFSFKYDSAPYYVLESYSSDTSIEDHQNFIQALQEIAGQNKIFSKVEFIGKV